jgi:hypothetical protein
MFSLDVHCEECHKLMLKDPKPKTHPDLESLAEAVVNLNKDPEG